MHAADGERAPLLLHSLATMREIIVPALDTAGARRIVEVGGETGGFTSHLAERARANDGHVHIVDPSPSSELEQLAGLRSEVTLVREPSPQALLSIEAADAYVIDGDHNYATVTGELAAVRERGGPIWPLVVLHDVGWPWARRDLYYRPDALPTEAVHPHTYEGGVRPGRREVGPGGFSGAGEFAYALEEGGPRNGVLTAVEDFLAEQPSLELVRVPCIFGLGFVYDRHAPYAERLRARLAVYDESALLARLEENRIALYLRLHDVLDDVETAVAERDETRSALDELRGALRGLAASKTVRAADALMLRRGNGLRRVLEDLAGDDDPAG